MKVSPGPRMAVEPLGPGYRQAQVDGGPIQRNAIVRKKTDTYTAINLVYSF